MSESEQNNVMSADFEIRDGHVLVPVSDFVAIQEKLEDLDDIRAYDEAIANAEEYFPIELAKSIHGGENPLKVFREYRGLTQAKLAELSGVSQPMIAAIEAGKKSGTVATMKSIAQALDLDIDDIV